MKKFVMIFISLMIIATSIPVFALGDGNSAHSAKSSVGFLSFERKVVLSNTNSVDEPIQTATPSPVDSFTSVVSLSSSPEVSVSVAETPSPVFVPMNKCDATKMRMHITGGKSTAPTMLPPQCQ